MTLSALGDMASDSKCAQLRYGNEKEFTVIADKLGVMNDFKVRLESRRDKY